MKEAANMELVKLTHENIEKEYICCAISKEVKRMRHIYIRGSLGLIWLAAAIVCGISGNFPMMGIYLVLAGVFLYSAYATWKKEKDGKGGK